MIAVMSYPASAQGLSDCLELLEETDAVAGLGFLHGFIQDVEKVEPLNPTVKPRTVIKTAN
eukprot:481689-Hanusia_phi.AAC.1